VDDNRTERTEARVALELGLLTCVHTIAATFPGDVDEYFVQGAPGGEFSVEFSTGNDPYGLDLQLVDAHTKDVVRYLSHGNDLLLSFGRLVFPDSECYGCKSAGGKFLVPSFVLDRDLPELRHQPGEAGCGGHQFGFRAWRAVSALVTAGRLRAGRRSRS
jgi:hypothetical protein